MADAKTVTQKNVEQFTQQAADYSRLALNAPSNRRTLLRDALSPTPDDLALDIACGTGAATLALAPSVQRIVGLDATPAMLDEARANQQREGLNNIEWREGDVYNLPFEDGAFSIVLCQSAFHHFARPRDVIAEMARVCRPGGRIAISDVTPAPDKVKAYDEIEIMRDPSHTHAFTLQELRALPEGLPLAESLVQPGITPHMPFESILRASRPTEHSLDEIRALLREDARTGADHWGFSAKLENDDLMVAYPMSIVVWR